MIIDFDCSSLDNFLARRHEELLPYLRLEDQNNKYQNHPTDIMAKKNVEKIVNKLFNKNPNKDNSDYYSINNNKKEPKKENEIKFLKKKRGKKKDKNSKIKGTKTKFDKNNINIKIKCYCDNCIVAYLNECLKLSKKYNNQKFFELCRKYKIKNINKSLESLKNKNLGDFIQNEITSKYKSKNGNKDKKNENINIFQQFEKDEILKNIFSENYFHFFKNVFYESKRRVKIKLNDSQSISINFPDKVLMFNDLLEKDKDEKYKEQLKKNALKYFIPNSIFFVNYKLNH